MPVLQKLNQARAKFHAEKIEKTGHNKFADYKYFELSDFIVPALKIFNEIGLCAVVSFTKEAATMRIFDLEDNSNVVIESPMSTAALKGCHEVQNLGAVQTYLRRYLWVAALEIVEHDAFDSGPEKRRGKASSGVTVEATRQNGLDELAAELVSLHQSGQDMKAIGIWYAGSTFADNEERLYVWGLLREYSALRRIIKANAPQKEAA